MKKPSSRSRPRSSYPPRHQFDHVVPTVIHDPEEKMTALGRLTRHVIQQPRRYLSWPLAILAGVLLVVVVWKLTSGGPSTDSVVWQKLGAAQSPAERVELVKDYPQSPATTWALLEAATDYFNQALSDLPNNRDVALPTAKKALDLFDQVEREAPRDSVQARTAALGKARVYEMRNELDKANEQYQLVVKNSPGTPEAEKARHYSEALKDPQAVAFYKELYAYSPTKVTLPPYGTENLPLPSLGGPSTGTTPTLTPSPLPVPSVTTTPGTPPIASPAIPNIPAIEEVIPPTLREIKVEPKSKTVTPQAVDPAKNTPPPVKAEPSQPAGTQDLPPDVFSSKPQS